MQQVLIYMPHSQCLATSGRASVCLTTGVKLVPRAEIVASLWHTSEPQLYFRSTLNIITAAKAFHNMPGRAMSLPTAPPFRLSSWVPQFELDCKILPGLGLSRPRLRMHQCHTINMMLHNKNRLKLPCRRSQSSGPRRAAWHLCRRITSRWWRGYTTSRATPRTPAPDQV